VDPAVRMGEALAVCTGHQLFERAIK
jgi:hypothetical protein